MGSSSPSVPAEVGKQGRGSRQGGNGWTEEWDRAMGQAFHTRCNCRHPNGYFATSTHLGWRPSRRRSSTTAAGARRP